MNNLKFKHRNAYTINTADNSAEQRKRKSQKALKRVLTNYPRQ